MTLGLPKALSRALCTGIYIRDLETVTSALELGANVDIACPEGINISKGSCTATTYNAKKYDPLGLAIDFLGSTPVCDSSATVPKDPDLDIIGLEIIKKILEYSPDLSKKYKYTDSTPLQEAIWHSAYQAAKLIVDKGELPDNALTTALVKEHNQKKNSDVPVWFHQYLHQKGANVNLMYHPTSPYSKSSVVITEARFVILEYYVVEKLIDWCLESADPIYWGINMDNL